MKSFAKSYVSASAPKNLFKFNCVSLDNIVFTVHKNKMRFFYCKKFVLCYNKNMKSSIFKNKRCPRCNFKVPNEIAVCPKCQLNYQKFNLATNGEAKLAISEGETDRVLYRKGCPNDVKKSTLLLLTIFWGLTGVHYYYVGRKGWGIFYSIFFVVGLINAFISVYFKAAPTGDWFQIFYLLVLVWGAVILMWMVDIIKVCSNSFKIPVSLPRV